MNKTALITGASRGIGWETALMLAAEYKYQVIALSRNHKQLELLKNTAAAEGGTILTLSHDFFKEDFSPVTTFLEKNNINSLDILINNAGFLIKKPIAEMQLSDLQNSYNVNVFSPYLLIQHLLPMLRNSSGAHVLNISSMGGFQGSAKFPGLSAYSSSKAAIAVLTECFAEELKEDHISVNCLCLGSVATEMLNEAFPGYKAAVEAKDMAQYICSFADKAHLVMNGKVIPVALSTP